MEHKDKHFVIQRRGGGHGPTVVPNPEDWYTPRWMYFNTNMLAPLPVTLNNNGKIDTFLHLSIEEDLLLNKDHLKSLSLKILLSDISKKRSSKDHRLPKVKIATIGHASGGLFNIPPYKELKEQIQVRLNNLHLGLPVVQTGWLLFSQIPPEFFAVGKNLVGISLAGSNSEQKGHIIIEKLEVHVRYKTD